MQGRGFQELVSGSIDLRTAIFVDVVEIVVAYKLISADDV